MRAEELERAIDKPKISILMLVEFLILVLNHIFLLIFSLVSVLLQVLYYYIKINTLKSNFYGNPVSEIVLVKLSFILNVGHLLNFFPSALP